MKLQEADASRSARVDAFGMKRDVNWDPGGATRCDAGGGGHFPFSQHNVTRVRLELEKKGAPLSCRHEAGVAAYICEALQLARPTAVGRSPDLGDPTSLATYVASNIPSNILYIGTRTSSKHRLKSHHAPDPEPRWKMIETSDPGFPS